MKHLLLLTALCSTAVSAQSTAQWELLSTGKASSIYLKRGSVEAKTETSEFLSKTIKLSYFTGMVLLLNKKDDTGAYFTYRVDVADCAKSYGTFLSSNLDTPVDTQRSGFAIDGVRLSDAAVTRICVIGATQLKEVK